MVYAVMEINANRTMTSSRSVFKTSDIDRGKFNEATVHICKQVSEHG